MVYVVVKHLHSLTHISVISLTLWRWCSGTFSSDSLRDKNCSPAENSAVEKPVLRERHENWTQDNNSSESVQNLWQNIQGKETKEEKRKRETNMLNVVASNSLISAHIYLILEGPLKMSKYLLLGHWRANKQIFIQFQSETGSSVFTANISAESAPVSIFSFSHLFHAGAALDLGQMWNFWYLLFATIPINHQANVRVDRPQGKLLWVVLCSNTTTSL